MFLDEHLDDYRKIGDSYSFEVRVTPSESFERKPLPVMAESFQRRSSLRSNGPLYEDEGF